jgi:two-component system, NtrC family, sensor histidine kinase HydH
MYPLIYFVVAALAAGLATRTWLADRDDHARISFLVLGWTVAGAYASFSLSLLPQLSALRAVYLAIGAVVPAAMLWTVDRIFPSERPSREVALLFMATALITPVAVAGHLLVAEDPARVSAPAGLVGALAFVGLSLVIRRLWQTHESAAARVERFRLRYLIGMVTAAAVLSLAEQLGRSLGPVPTGISPTDLHGPFPPLSVVFTGLSVYLLHHSVVLSRLLDIHELFGRLAKLVVASVFLTIVIGLGLVGSNILSSFHTSFQVFLASLVFLGIYDPLSDHLAWYTNRVFNQRGQQLAETIDDLRRAVGSLTKRGALVDTLLDRLQASGRAPVVSVYLWDRKLGAFACKGHRAAGDESPLRAVAAVDFIEGFRKGAPWYARPTLEHRRSTLESVLGLLDAMHADLAVPFGAKDRVLGWLCLRDEAWSDGYSAEEIQRLAALCDQVGLMLSNIRDFQVRGEERRLAALGAMATGLAHEIRNPLAGVKGATQFLEDEVHGEDAREMLQVIVDEVDRLDSVVRQFLDYARPFELQRAQQPINALVTHVLTLTRAQSHDAELVIEEKLAGDLPLLWVDATRLQQVLFNLVRNALQAMPEGGTLTVETRRIPAGRQPVEIRVSDTGRGISPEALDRIFLPFFTTKSDGTGLGLAICHRIVTAHGGELHAQSRADGGATFLVRLHADAAPVLVPQTDVGTR